MEKDADSMVPSSQPARSILFRLPTVEDLEEQELNAEMIPNDQITDVLTATERAVEQFRRISTPVRK
ncbi:hypothetical protein L210DRAFT_3645991 [Boletus edulis BED1]|uniref:Uncharacterized protein n=1 Tax=Boletus edulis BED1 TaxID=1328754 RepID=A0AAD4BU10_BOLED|nr:hypothetical protein L210DRAFT_3645991 [Boletus edulis BED1]